MQGHAIPKGTSIIFFQTLGLEESPGWSLPSTRPDKPTGGAVPPWQAGTAYTFSPERWLDPQGRFDAHAGPSAPFGNGHRTCFGRNLAVSIHVQRDTTGWC